MPKQSLNINKFIQFKDPSKAFVFFLLLFLENPHRKSNGDTRISTDNEWKKDSRERLWKWIAIFIVMKTFTSIQIFMQNHHFEFRFQWRRRHTTKGKVNNAIAVGGRRQKGIGLQKKNQFSIILSFCFPHNWDRKQQCGARMTRASIWERERIDDVCC